MRTLQDVRRFLERVPRGFLADGRPVGLGLASALDAQRDRREARTVKQVLPQQRDDQLAAADR